MSKRRLVTLESLTKRQRTAYAEQSEDNRVVDNSVDDNCMVDSSVDDNSVDDNSLADFIVSDNDPIEYCPVPSRTLSESEPESEPESESESESDTYLLSLTNAEKTKLLDEKARIDKLTKADIPQKYKIYNLNAPDNVKVTALKYYNNYQNDQENAATLKIALDYICEIPWGIHKKISVNLSDGYDAVNKFLEQSYQVMNKEVYGHPHAKSEIIEFMSELLLNPNASRVIGLCGPPGIGKTSLIKYGIANALGLPLETISLSGESGVEFLTGMLPAWKSSGPGCIIKMLTHAGCMNPIIYIDEPDKVSGTDRGDEISKFLIKFTDPEQSCSMHFKFIDLDMDLSKAIIILSYNHKELIDPVLLDRIKHIDLNGFDRSEKLVIARDYTIPKMLDHIGLTNQIEIPEDVVKYINSRIDPDIGTGVRKQIQGYQTLFSRIITNLLTSRIGFDSIVNKKTTITIQSKNRRTRSKKRPRSNSFNSYQIDIDRIPFKLTKAHAEVLLESMTIAFT